MAAEAHGYGRYSSGGCRCEVCRAAKATYVRNKRRGLAEMRFGHARFGEDIRRYVVTGITHGISGYQDYQCRCDTCRLAKAEAGARETRRKARV